MSKPLLAYDKYERPIRCPICNSGSWRRNLTDETKQAICLRCGARYEVELPNPQ